MLKKVLLALALLVCIVVTIFLVQELSLEKIQVDSSYYFEEEDSIVYVINHPTTVDFTRDGIQPLELNRELYMSIAGSIPENCSVFLSHKRGLIVFEGRYGWNKASIKEVFINGKHKIAFTKLKHFTYGPYNGFYSKNQMILYQGKVPPSVQKSGFRVDKKASYSIVSMNKSNPEVKDYYKKKKYTICYQDTKTNLNKGVNQNDRDVFSRIVPDDFTEYTFYEKQFLYDRDAIFKNNPIQSWTAAGMVILRNKGSSLAIIELKAGQSSIENLNEHFDLKVENENYAFYPKLLFTDQCPSSKGYYVMDMQGYSIISGDKDYFDQIATEIKMGNSLSMNKKKSELIFDHLPENVLYRYYSLQNKKSITRSGSKLIETSISDKEQAEAVNKDSRHYFSMNPSEPIESFYAYSGRGNTFLITRSNKWIRYENGIRKWEKVFDKPVIGAPKLMEMSSLQHTDISILFNDEVLIVDRSGRVLNRFPCSGGVHPIRCRLRNEVSFLIPKTDLMEVTDYDGKVISSFNFSSEIRDMVLFNRNGKKHVAVLCKEKLFIINLIRKRTVLKVPLNQEYKLTGFEERTILIDIGQSHIVDLEGNKSRLSIPDGFSYKTAFLLADELNLVFSDENELLVMNQKGQFNWKRSLPCTSIDKVFVHQPTKEEVSTEIQIGILDGIENKIVLLDSQGKILDNVKRHGEKDVQITSYGNQGISITTFLGNYLIQYAKF